MGGKALKNTVTRRYQADEMLDTRLCRYPSTRDGLQKFLTDFPNAVLTEEEINEGWKIDVYLGAQNSIRGDSANRIVNTRIYRFVK